ncbi:MAG: acyltransferase family protein [Lachnospiraceae bacterium]|nr:acyltransferase family protein [Lachnospiraceae bacterium]
MPQKRLTYFDTVKGIGIFLVLLGHFQGEWFFSLSPYVSPLCTWIFSFHMPLFFIVSGMLIHYRRDTEKDLKDLTSRRFYSIMIPYFWFSLIYLLIVLYALIRGSVTVHVLFEQIWYVLSMYGMNVLWFLPALFGGEILFLLIYKRFVKITPLIVLVLTGAATAANYALSSLSADVFPWKYLKEFGITLLRPVFVCVFIAVGFYIYKLFREREKYCLPELLAGLALMAVNIFVHPLNRAVDFRSLVQGNLAFYYIAAVTGSVGLILICKNLPAIRPVTFWGINSLIVMAVHNNETVLYLGMKLAMIINQYITRARGYVSYLVVTIVMVVYTTLMILLINRFFGFLVGKPSPFDRLLKKKKEA